MSATFAHSHHSSDASLRVRALLAEQAFRHTEYTLELLAGFVKRTAARLAQAYSRWSAAHEQAAQDRIFWELALTDPRLMADIHAMQQRAETGESRG